MRLTIDDNQLKPGAAAWWRSLDPGTRGVFLQALWEIQQCPAPRDPAPRDPAPLPSARTAADIARLFGED